MNTEIFLPMFYLMLQTVVVMLFSSSIRLKEIYLNKNVAGEEQRHPPFDQGSRVLKNAQRNLANLFEFPILFYAVCICIYMTGNVDEYFITLAYSFFYLRVIHSIYHIFFNQLIINGGLPVRSFIWVPATATLVWMWVRFISVI
jgi:hypothetical protein